ncbi:hypothetical protein [Microbacterium karelineae]|uniref:hypothetical protein n=1 Tax=Microbacterium karelineae TaxID=2654283 RepID=UPI0012EA2845|nr:hypothetical protein [Microbacterium karelineae]
MTDQSRPSSMPWAQRTSGDGIDAAIADPGAAARDAAGAVAEQHGDAIAQEISRRAGVDAGDANAVIDAAMAGDDRREALQKLGVHMASEYADKVGIEVEASEITQRAEALATTEGRREAMQELGVHMSGRLAERYGVEDAEAKRLLEASRALRTAEGRAQLMAEYGRGAGDELVTRLTGRGLSIDERREAMTRLLEGDAVAHGLKKAGRGILVGGILAILVLVGVLIGAVALLGAVLGGGSGDAAALVADIATRPDVAAFVAGVGHA